MTVSELIAPDHDRALDAAVAIHVFGWRWYAQPGLAPDTKERAGLWPPAGRGFQRWNLRRDARLLGKTPGRVPLWADWDRLGSAGEEPAGLPRYSSARRAALGVLDRVQELTGRPGYTLSVDESGLATVQVAGVSVTAMSEAAAICRAALLALGVQPDRELRSLFVFPADPEVHTP